MESEKELLALLEEISTFERKFSLDNRFNVFEALNMVRQEIRHSRFLAFLLNPAESHGLGDKFLRSVLLAAASNHPNPPVSKLALAIADFSGALVYCERDHFDITVQIPDLRLMFVIENKIDASEREEQLQDYRLLAGQRYNGYKFMGCFLTPKGIDAGDEEWSTLNYGVISAELKRLADETPATAVSLMINHYVELIDKRIMVSEELITACRRIYAQHRNACNLIVQYGQVPVLAEAFQSFQAEYPALNAVTTRSSDIYFVDESWLANRAFQVADTTRWEASCPVKLWFHLEQKKLFLRLEVGPVRAESGFDRSTFVEKLRDLPGARQHVPRGGIYTRVRTCSHGLSEDADVEEIKRAMDELWKTMGSSAVTETVLNMAATCWKGD